MGPIERRVCEARVRRSERSPGTGGGKAAHGLVGRLELPLHSASGGPNFRAAWPISGTDRNRDKGASGEGHKR